jgi:hypothetical protein
LLGLWRLEAAPPPPTPAFDDCTSCVIAYVQDETAPECAEFQAACK